MTAKLYEHVWCLLCEQQPADGYLCRVTPNGSKVLLGENEKIPHVCLPCGRDVNRTEGKPFHGFSTLWRFVRFPARQSTRR